MPKPSFRKTLSAPGLLETIRQCFDQIDDTKTVRSISLSNCLMSGLALFGLKYPSLLQFDMNQNEEPMIRSNLQSLYNVTKAPSDTYLRERLDEVDPVNLRKPFKQLFALLQRGKGLEDMQYFDGYYLLSLDGTGYFSSSEVHCDQCCEKHHSEKRGRSRYYLLTKIKNREFIS